MNSQTLLLRVCASKRLTDQLIYSIFAVRSKYWQTNRHLQVTFSRLISVGSKQPVPPWQVKSKVAVGFVFGYGVMDSMHVRCHDKAS